MPDLKHFGLCEPWPLADGAAVAVAVDAAVADVAAIAVDAAVADATAVAVDADSVAPAAADECAVKDEQPPHPPRPEI